MGFNKVINRALSLFITIMLLFILLPPGDVFPAGAASDSALNGTWQRQFLERPELEAIEPDRWETVQVPSLNQGGKGHFAAYRTNFFLGREV